MHAREFKAWIRFWEATPFDDEGRYHRPAALLANAMNGLDIKAALKWLSRDTQPEFDGFSEADINTFKALGIKPPARKG